MTPAEALGVLLAEAKAQGVQLSRTGQMRFLYLADLRAHRHGCADLTGLDWMRADHGPFNKSVAFLPKVPAKDVAAVETPWREHVRAVVEAYGKKSHEEVGLYCFGSAPMRKAPKHGNYLNLDETSSNDVTNAVTAPA